MQTTTLPRVRHVCVGLTLIELLATLAVALVLLLAGLPGYSSLIENQRIQSRSTLLLSHLHLARSESVERLQRVALCPAVAAPDLTLCAPGYDWSHGWLVFVDLNRDREYQHDEPLVQRAGTAALKVLTSPGRPRIVYEPDGSVIGGSNATFRLCSPLAAAKNRAVIISNTGRPRQSKNNAQNEPVEC